MRPLQANLMLLLAGAIWGMGFIAQSSAMATIGPILFVGLRFVIATLAVLPFALAETRGTHPPMTRDSWLGFLAIGLALFCGMVLQQIGLLTTSVTNSGFLTGLYVIFVPIVMVLAFRVIPHPVVWPATALAFAGLFLLSGGAIVSLQVGDVLTIIAAVFWAMQVILVASFARRSDRPLLLSLVQFAVCAACGMVLAFVFEPVSLSAIWSALPEILFAGAIASGLAFSLQAIGQRHTTPALAAILLSTEALFAAVFGAAFLGERIGSLGYVGGLLIVAAIILVEALPAWRLQRLHPPQA